MNSVKFEIEIKDLNLQEIHSIHYLEKEIKSFLLSHLSEYHHSNLKFSHNKKDIKVQLKGIEI